MAPHSSILAWKIPWMEEPDRLQMRSLRVGHNWATSLSLFIFMHWRRKWQPAPLFLPGESQGWGSLVGCLLWGCTELVMPSVIRFSSYLQSFPASGSFPLSQLFASGGQNIGVSASTSVLPMKTQYWFPLGWTGWSYLQSKGLSRVFSNNTVQKHQFFGTQLYIHIYLHIIDLIFNSGYPSLCFPISSFVFSNNPIIL